MVRRLFLFALSVIGVSYAFGQQQDKKEPLMIAEQGSFAIGGTVITNPGVYDPIERTP